MPRKAFLADVVIAAESSVTGISEVARGNDDESVYATFTPTSGHAPVEIELLVQPDLSSYPKESSYMIFSRSTILPDGVGNILQNIADSSAGLTILDVLVLVSQKLQRNLATGTAQDPMPIESDDAMEVDGFDNSQSEEESDDEEEYFGDSDHDTFGGGHAVAATTATFKISPESATKINRRIKEDLRAVRLAGFKVGVLVGLKADSVHSLLSLSIQVAKLGLSDEAMQAWDLESQQYLVLLIRYSNGYKSFETIINEPAKSLDVAFRVGMSKKYKPTVAEALTAFVEISKKKESGEDGYSQSSETTTAGFTTMFISSSLNELINMRFVSLLKIRYNIGVGWDGAKSYFNNKEGRIDETAELPSEYYVESTPKTHLENIVTSDHLTDMVKQFSFPLVAMQFALRYTVRCTEFCLVCHDKMTGDFEALKPYVCEKPLCLYQYMNLGFGPSVEHEILTQPYVVDLLVSFCYSSAMSRRLREYPNGMSLSVPPIQNYTTVAPGNRYGMTHAALPPTALPAPVKEKTPFVEYVVKYNQSQQELIFESTPISPVHRGDWLIVTGNVPQHFRVEDVSLYPTVTLSKDPVFRRSNGFDPAEQQATLNPPHTPSVTPPPTNFVVTKALIYNNNFDDMDDSEKAETIAMLIETMPSIKEMKRYLLQQSRLSQPSLRSWNERLSPAALGMLRWIIASNRSCIVQVDKCPGQDDNDLALSKIPLHQRVSNISEDWVQFRFAQGSPDKEQRFLNALREQQANLNPNYPTLFAFHGSPLHNWHSIIRTGLDFKETIHGRAFGHGVYHSQDQSTSVGYAQFNQVIWHGSDLKISSAMSLNEIINCPLDYASRTPHLVVQHLDWIQCRYLMVQITAPGSRPQYAYNQSAIVSKSSDGASEVEQDPSYIAKSTLRQAIGVPFCATSTSRNFRVDQNKEKSHKRQRSSKSPLHEGPQLQSDSEDEEDLAFLISDDEEDDIGKGKETERDFKASEQKLTDFVPGSLDQSTLPMLEEPTYATPMATKTLNRALKDILEVQKKTPMHELGWYIDSDLINNVYQWIVELHSFDPDLPLSKDMKLAGVTSIVMEVRFPKDYPFSPPFLRVIRPRFLPFTMGGGGHVTAGGAMCMELLTTSGWSAVSSIEGVLLQVRLAISNLEPRPARLENHGRKVPNMDYSTGEAVAAYIRACQTHGWTVPESFKDFAAGAGPTHY